MSRPLFVTSLDFELHWGLRDHVPLDACRQRLLGVREAVPALLSSFERFGVHATWATVGMLYCGTKRELVDMMPSRLPQYENANLSPYGAMDELGTDEKDDPFHFAPSLIAMIRRTAGQELGTHTFSHFYCLEPGQTSDDFDADLAAAARVSEGSMRSIVFPRNQWNPDYDAVLARHGVAVLRSNGAHWAYTPSTRSSFRQRAFRFADSYATLRHRIGTRVARTSSGLTDVPASMFLRPYNPRLRSFEGRRVGRIMSAMTSTAKRGDTFHLWWHPHNFGKNIAENLRSLEIILAHFAELRARHGMESATMSEAAASLS